MSISFEGALAVLFIGLKLTHYIDWPWLWVLCPIWLPLVIFLGALVGVGLAMTVIWIVERIIK